MSTTVTAPAGGLAAEIRAAIEAINRRTGYLGPSVHQLERWAAEAERLEASRLHKPEVPRHRVANPIPQDHEPGRAVEAEHHPDNQAVDRFAAAMKDKLAHARANGRSGWQHLSPEELSRMLREHVEKGDPRDVANFCAFLWNLGHGIHAQDDEPLNLARAWPGSRNF